MSRLPSLLASALLLAGIGYASQTVQPCVAVDFTLRAYDGPVSIQDACLASFTHAGDRMTITAIDLGDGIYRGGFEVWP